MTKRISLRSEQLRAAMPPARIKYATSLEIPLKARLAPPQPRALQALELALSINDPGYNVYLAGEVNLGRSYMLNDFLAPKARKRPSPPDLVYVYNFADADAPLLLQLPQGQGVKLKAALNKALARIRKELPAYMERDSYTRERSSLQGKYQNEKVGIFKSMDKVADTQGFKLDVDDSGSITLYPVVEGKKLSEEEFENLGEKERDSIKKKGDSLAQSMHSFMRKLGRVEQDLLDGERGLEKEVAAELLCSILDPVAAKFKSSCNGNLPENYFKQISADILDNLDYFLPPEQSGTGQHPPHYPGGGHEGPPFDEIAHRYDVNVFVDNSKTQGAPIVMDDHPTVANLLGCIEREAEMGALVTNFTLVKAGSLHKANGGFLILQAEEALQNTQAWDGLLRALRSGQARLDDAGDGGDSVKTKGLRPDPLKLDVKVILIGNEDIYEALLFTDSRFGKLFKIKAQMSGKTPRDSKGIQNYLLQTRRIIEEAGLPHFEREALAGLVDFGSLLLEDQRSLSLEFPLLRELMLEASAMARADGAELVGKAHLRKALEAREYRLNLVEEAFMEEYDRKLIKVATSGQAVGQVNGLSVASSGDFEFGLPHQISCTVGVGNGGIVDLEREANLGGPIHTKAIMILKSYLTSLFARKKPLVLTGSICFEQSYAGIEGDSASGAELVALISAIAQVPVDLGLAFTGAVSQSGQIMAVGSVTRKVESFFEVCSRHGLTGRQGVILPRDNLAHLMLKQSVLDAVDEGRFHIYPVEHINEALDILTGMPCGKQRKDLSFTPGSLYDLADRRLAELTRLAARNMGRAAGL